MTMVGGTDRSRRALDGAARLTARRGAKVSISPPGTGLMRDVLEQEGRFRCKTAHNCDSSHRDSRWNSRPRQGPGYLRSGRAAADRRHRPAVGVRLRPAQPDPGQGQGAEPDLLVLVPAVRNDHACNHVHRDRRSAVPRSPAAVRRSAPGAGPHWRASWRCCPSSALPGGTWPDPAGRSTRRKARFAGSGFLPA